MANYRIKTGHLPGDIPKSEEQLMLEKKEMPHALNGTTLKKQREIASGYKKEVMSSERAVLKRRTKVRIRQDLEE